MDKTIEAAAKAADTLTQTALGAICVLLAVALVSSIVYFLRRADNREKQHDAELAAKDALIQGLQAEWRSDTKASTGALTAALETVRVLKDAITGGQK